MWSAWCMDCALLDQDTGGKAGREDSTIHERSRWNLERRRLETWYSFRVRIIVFCRRRRWAHTNDWLLKRCVEN
jgi:hypothetical protein